MFKAITFLTAIVVALVAMWPNVFYVAPLFSDERVCPVPSIKAQMDHDHTQHILYDEGFKHKAIERFAGGLRIDTTVDDEATDEDFQKFQVFHDYLAEQYPLVHKHAGVTLVNEWSLVYEIPGSDPGLKPVLFMAHQDTVPFGDLSTWTKDPLGGLIDYEEGVVYGRGANDIKNLLMGLLGALEELLDQNNGELNLKRGLILAFGHDEEISGNYGAYHVGQYILGKYGPKSIDHIMDEGAPMFLGLGGMNVGLVITAEKGYMDIEIEVDTPGGHSSNPRKRTSIGILSEIVENYEHEEFKPLLIDANPFLSTLECVGEQSNKIPYWLKMFTRIVRKNPVVNYLVSKFIITKPLLKYIIQTAQAVDVIRGGDKINALPRTASAYINHRLTLGDTPETVFNKAKKHALRVAKNEDLGLVVNGEVILPKTKNGNIMVKPFGKITPTSPPTPLFDETWDILTSNMKTFYEQEVYPERLSGPDAEEVYIIAPSSMQGNTDTRHYWQVTDHIYRVQPGITNLFKANMHGNNEWVHIESHLQVIGFYYNYIRNICM